MFEKVKRYASLALALIMVFCLAACGESGGSSEETEIVYQYEYEYESDGNQSGDNQSGGNQSGGNQSGGNQSGGNQSGGNQSSNQSGGNQSGGNQSGGNQSGGNQSGGNQAGVNSDKLRGSVVRYATWKDPDLNEDGPVIDSFEREYGITVKIDMVNQSEYAPIIQGMIAAKDSPDVYFCNGDFPACLSCLQPLKNAKLDTKDPIWDQSMFRDTTVNGDYYLCDTMGNIWKEVDLCFYNKSLWRDAGFTQTPEELDKAGKWNWDTIETIATEISKMKNKSGIACGDTSIALGAAGCQLFTFKNGKFGSGLDNKNVVKVLSRLSDWNKAGIAGGNRDTFADGNTGIYFNNAFGLKATGYFKDSNWSDIGFYYLPDFKSGTTVVDAVPTGIFRGWGLVNGAKNPEGAGVFLRYYLDVNNYDTSSAFISKEAETFFFQLTTGSNDKRTPYHTYCDDVGAIADVNTGGFYTHSVNLPSNQIQSYLDSVKNSIKAGADKLNKYLKDKVG